MKSIFSLFVLLLLSTGASAQSSLSQADYYAQSLVYLQTDLEYNQLQQLLRENPNVRVARIDKHSHQLFVITKDTGTFDESVLRAWLGGFSPGITCVHIGIRDVTPQKTYLNGECPN